MEKQVYYIQDITRELNISYKMLWTKIKSTEETKHIIRPGKRKILYSRQEFQLIINHCFTTPFPTEQ